MGKNSKSNVAWLLSAMLILGGLIYGCYSHGSGSEKTNSYGQAVKPDSLSEEALRKFADSVRIIDGDAEAHYKLALYFQERSRHKLAIDELKQVLMRNPVHAKAFNALGVSWDNLGDHEAAIDYYKLALGIDSKLDFAYNNLGYSYLLKGENQKAVEAFKQAIALKADEKRYRNNLGLAYAKQEKFDLAYEQFRSLESDAIAQKTFSRVMQDLGVGHQTERVLIATQSSPKIESPPVEVEKANKLPELVSAAPASESDNDPVKRFRSVTRSLTSSPSDHPNTGVESTGSSVQKEILAEEGLSENEDALVEVKAGALAGPVIDLRSVAKQSPGWMDIPSGQLKSKSDDLVAKNEKPAEYHHVSSVIISHDSLQSAKPASAGKSKIVLSEKMITKQPRAILPPKYEIVSKVNTEEQEERILLASSSTKAGGWQSAPEPKQTAEKGLVEVEVANGNGVRGSAAKVAEHLRRSGFMVVRVMDANSFDHFNTKVFYYGGNLGEAQRLLKAIPEIAADAELYELQNMGNHIRLLIGQDLVSRNRTLTWNNPNKLRPQAGS